MRIFSLIESQIDQIRAGDREVLLDKTLKAIALPFWALLYLCLHLCAIPIVLLVRLLRPWLLIRFGQLISDRIGHFAANTELYLCEKDAGLNVPSTSYLDIFYNNKSTCNRQLLLMWKRVLHIWPRILLLPVHNVNRCLYGWEKHEIGSNTQADRDVNNLLEEIPIHLNFTPEEELEGQRLLQEMGLSHKDKFVCLLVRDSAYLPDSSWSYHAYRDSSISNYRLAAEELSNRGYYVIRMGAKVHSKMESSIKRIIDYATNGMRSDFMDIYLGAKCEFCISTSSGWDAVPLIFRRPIAYTNMVPLGYLFTFVPYSIGLTKAHFSTSRSRNLTFKEIFSEGLGFAMTVNEYEAKGVQLVENTPEEIRDLAIEFEERLRGNWIPGNTDEILQRQFWDIFPSESVQRNNRRRLHGIIHMKYSTHFLRNNAELLT